MFTKAPTKPYEMVTDADQIVNVGFPVFVARSENFIARESFKEIS